MNGFLVAADRDDLRARAHRLAEWRGHTDQANADIDNYIAAVAQPWIVGTPEEIVARLREYESAGVEAVMLQHHIQFRQLRRACRAQALGSWRRRRDA